jgi:quercetin dioxygenase-like cupin family protein
MPGMTDAVDTEAVRRRWAAEGYGCDLWVDPPGQVWRDFVHPTDELVCVVEGEIEVEIDLEAGGRTDRLGPGGEVHIPAGAVHTVRNVGGVTARWLYGYRRAGQ